MIIVELKTNNKSHLLNENEGYMTKKAEDLLLSKGFYLNKVLGQGAFGQVWEIERIKDGKRFAAKYLLGGKSGGSIQRPYELNREIENYTWVKENRDKLGKYKYILPEVYYIWKDDSMADIEAREDEALIIMELLSPLPSDVADELFRPGSVYNVSDMTKKRFSKNLLKNPDFLQDLFKDILNFTIRSIYDRDPLAPLIPFFEKNKEKIVSLALKELYKGKANRDDEYEDVIDALANVVLPAYKYLIDRSQNKNSFRELD